MTDEIHVLVKPTPKLCQECVDNSRHQNEHAGIVWCPHHMSGGLYLVEIGLWQITGPFQQEADFKRYVLNWAAQARKGH